MKNKKTIILRSGYHKNMAIEAIEKAQEGYVVIIGPPMKTNPQLRLVHKWFSEIQTFFMENCGKAYLQEDIKVWAKGLFLPMVPVNTPGGVKMKVLSLSEIDIKTMSEFMDSIYHYMGSEFGCYLTDPKLPDQ